MWVYEKKLEYPVCIKSKDLKMAQLLLTQYGWAVGRVICFSAIFDPALHDADRADQGSFNRYRHRRISSCRDYCDDGLSDYEQCHTGGIEGGRAG